MKLKGSSKEANVEIGRERVVREKQNSSSPLVFIIITLTIGF